MQITPAALDAIYYNFSTIYQSAYDMTELWSDALTTMAPSSTRSNRYAWMEQLPRMREWIGERQVHNLSARAYTLDNKDYEDTIEIDRNDIEDDSYNIFRPNVEGLASQAKKWKDDVVAAVLQAGTTQLGFDSQYFFDTDHPNNLDSSSSTTYVNLHTSKPLTLVNYAYVRSYMGAILGADGRPLKVRPTLLIVPPQLETQARQILNAETVAPSAAFGVNASGGFQTNVYKGSAQMIVVPELANEAANWYLADTSKPIKPLIWQLRRSPAFTQLTAANDANVFWHKKFIYGVDARGAGGYTLPFLMARCEG